MPQRFLRPGIRTSPRWNAVSHRAARLYISILTLVDDYGRYDGRVSVLWAETFAVWNEQNPQESAVNPLETAADCTQLAAAGLVGFYEVSGRQYLQVIQWQETPRGKSKWPDPPQDFDNNPPPVDSKPPRNPADSSGILPPSSSSSSSSSPSSSSPPSPPPCVELPAPRRPAKEDKYHKDSRVALLWLNDKSGRAFRETSTNLIRISARLNEPDITLDGVKQMIERMVAKWKGTEQEEYLRPETLFGKEKFGGYYDCRNVPLVNPHTKQKPGPGAQSYDHSKDASPEYKTENGLPTNSGWDSKPKLK